MQYRKLILEKAEHNPALQTALRERAKHDLIWWLDTWVYTFAPKDFPDHPHRPFISWGFQERVMLDLAAAIGKEDRLIEKSRDMGASWMCLMVFLWRWCYWPGQSFLVGSRKEEYVDTPGKDPKTLFYKLRYALERLPSWLCPTYESYRLHLVNVDMDGTIDGESTNEDFGRGDRRTGVLMDEFASCENGYELLRATRDVSKCRIFNSTPKGTGNAYYSLRQSFPKHRVITLHWVLHPLKSIGLYHDAKGKPRSIWYDDECSRAASSQEIAQELDIAYAESGWQFFSAEVIERLTEEFGLDPQHEGEVAFDEDKLIVLRLDARSGGRLRLWLPLIHTGRPAPGKYGVACDIATGKGGEKSSNSVASIANLQTGEKVGEWVCRHTPPGEFAKLAISLCRWFCDENGQSATLIWEDGGPGVEFGLAVRDAGFHHVWRRPSKSRGASDDAGWASTKDTKRALLSRYKSKLMEGAFTNRSREAIRECGEYVHEPNGKIEHSRAFASGDPTATGEDHGDRVIADALACHLIHETPAARRMVDARPKFGTYEFRQKRRREQERREGQW